MTTDQEIAKRLGTTAAQIVSVRAAFAVLGELRTKLDPVVWPLVDRIIEMPEDEYSLLCEMLEKEVRQGTDVVGAMSLALAQRGRAG